METLGWDTNKVKFNPNLFVTIRPYGYNNSLPSELQNIQVVGKLLSDDESLSVSWESALEGNSVDNNLSISSALMLTGTFQRLFGVGSKFVGKTFISEYESIQVFRGVEPLTLNMTLEFVAFEDAYKEVELPLQMLYKMMTPQLTEGLTDKTITLMKSLLSSKKGDNALEKATSEYSKLGEAPNRITLDYLGKRFSGLYVLESISASRDELKLTKDGSSIKREVSLSFKAYKSINRKDVIIKTKA
jgi:phage protein U